MAESFSINPGEPLHEGLRRVLGERTQAALSVLASKQPPAKQVHEVRKRLKELRAGWRLARSAVEADRYAAENAGLRDTARPLSRARDAEVMLEAMASLKKHFKKELSPGAFQGVRRSLERRRKRIVAAEVSSSHSMEQAAGYLNELQERLGNLGLDEVQWAGVGAGLERSYRQGRRAMRRGVADRKDDSLHQWRKRVKDLRYQLTILQPLWPELLKPLIQQTHTLGAELGDDHDLAVLFELLDTELRQGTPKQERQALQALIVRRRKTLQHQAKRLGRRVYAEKPKRFIKRIQAYWRSLD